MKKWQLLNWLGNRFVFGLEGTNTEVALSASTLSDAVANLRSILSENVVVDVEGWE